MAWRYSTGLVNARGAHKSLKEALHGYVIRMYSGTQPATADAAVTSGSVLLATMTLNGDTFDGTASTRQVDKIVVGSSTEAHTFNVSVDGGTTYTYTAGAGSSTTIVATALAAAIDASDIVSAVSSGADVIVRARFGGVAFTLADETSTGTVTLSTLVANARTNGLNWGAVADGVLSKEAGVWEGDAVADGQLNWFRICRYADAGGLSTSEIRADGFISTTSGEMILTSITTSTGVPVRLDTATITLVKVRT